MRKIENIFLNFLVEQSFKPVSNEFGQIKTNEIENIRYKNNNFSIACSDPGYTRSRWLYHRINTIPRILHVSSEREINSSCLS